MKNIKKELFNVKGGEFPKWYNSLTKYEKIQYKKILEDVNDNFRGKR
jgi:hypothetical protein|tara:strand:- start:3691 stop:3831 length:141 start_codon:yes stop_codon:yes gene_type:complete